MVKELKYKLLLPEWTSTDEGLIQEVLTKEMGLSKHEVSRLKFDGEILLNGKRVHTDEHMNIGDELIVRFPEDEILETTTSTIIPTILYEEEDFVIVDKPAGIPTHPSANHLNDSMGTALQAYYNNQGQSMTIRPIGRLDQDVSGICVFAKNQPAAARLNEALEKRELKKEYIGIAQGKFSQKEGTIDLPIQKVDDHLEREVSDDGKPAITHYQVVEELVVNDKEVSKLKLNIDTGRTHQIRAHLKAIGHPLLGDALYQGDTSALNRPALHCANVALTSPFTKKVVTVSSKLPEDIRTLIGEKEEEVVITKDKAAVVMPTFKDHFLKGLKWLLALLLLGALLVGGYFGINYYRNQAQRLATEKEEKRQALYDSLNITFPTNITFEYGDEFDPEEFAKDHVGELTILQGIDTKRVGTQTLKYQLSTKDEDGEEVTREFEQVITIQDTKHPVIKLKDEKVSVAFGDFFDESANVEEVFDEVDGKLSEAKTLAKGKYVIQSEVNTRKEGTYTVTIDALDNNENKTSASYEVIVGNGVSSTPTATPEITGNTDTTKPYILIRADEVRIQKGTAYDPAWNVIYVTDETDGQLAYQKEETNGAYTFVHSIDVNKPGSYDVKIIAKDKAGNQETDEFVLIVEGEVEEEKEEPTPTPEATGKDTTKPYILIRRDDVYTTIGTAYDPSSNIITIEDDVDGALPYSEKEGNGVYTITHQIDINKEGTYDVKITAKDKAGNVEYDDFNVIVREQPSSSSAFSGGDNASIIYQFIVNDLGLNDAVACGILGHIVRESGYQPTAYNPAGYYGICQWGGGRYDRLLSYCAENGLDSGSLEGQLRFLQLELNSNYSGVYDQLKAVENTADGAYNAAYIFGMQYEVSGEYLAASAGETAMAFFNQ